jgi:hypothetical protein
VMLSRRMVQSMTCHLGTCTYVPGWGNDAAFCGHGGGGRSFAYKQTLDLLDKVVCNASSHAGRLIHYCITTGMHQSDMSI